MLSLYNTKQNFDFSARKLSKNSYIYVSLHTKKSCLCTKVVENVTFSAVYTRYVSKQMMHVYENHIAKNNHTRRYNY